jgi:hypothetical protein
VLILTPRFTEAATMTEDVRTGIIKTYAEWTALSALRSGAPIKSRRDVYTVLRTTDFGLLFDTDLGPIDRKTFDPWHEAAVANIIQHEPRLTTGWAAKIVNVYLKPRVYIAAQGRERLNQCIHPLIDAGLWIGLARRFADRPDILANTHCVNRIKDIVNYGLYLRIIEGYREAASVLGCHLLEVEQLWAGTEFAELA